MRRGKRQIGEAQRSADNPLTAAEVRRIWGHMHCSNCNGGDNLAYDNKCAMLLCRHCRARRVANLRHLTTVARVDRALGLQGVTVPGTYAPAEGV